MQTREGNHMRKIHKVAGAILGLTIGAVMGTGAASAAVTHHRHHHITVQPGGPIILLSTIGSTTSQNLAGYSLNGNGGDRFRDIRAEVTVPSESSAVPGQAVVVGITQAASVNGGVENGLGFVWDASSTTCLAGQWTLEDAADVNVGSPMPIPPADLSALLSGGADVCLTGGQSYALEIYYNSGSHFVHFIAGPSFSDTNTLADVPDGGYHNFYSGGWGIDTTSGADAATLASGPAGTFGAAAVTQYNGKRHALDTRNTEEWIGTVSGGSVSVSNPETLTPSPLGAGFAVTAP
jgi:hypothetical protein